ncbi:hypothetical protein Chor_014420 [Crotalus horridus]
MTNALLSTQIIMTHYAKILKIESAKNASGSFLIEEVLKDPTIMMLWSLSVSMFAVGGMISSFTVGWIGEKMPRIAEKMIVLMIKMLQLVPLFVCICPGLSSGLAPLYVGEIAPTALRGALGTLNQLAVVIGILISQVLGLDILLGTQKCWPLLLSLSGGAAVLQIFLLLICPESPRYMYIKCGDAEGAQKKIEEMEKEKEELSKEKSVSIWQLATTATYRQPFIVAIGVHIAQQFSGINALFLVEKAGRRILFMAGLLGMMVCTITMTLGLVLQKLLGSYVFLVFAALLLLFVLFVYLKVPETKGKSFEEIAEEFRRRSKKDIGGPTEMEYLGATEEA